MTASQTTTPTSTPSAPSPPTPKTFIGELYSIPVVNRACHKVSSTHATLSRVVPLYSRLVTTVLSIATALTRRVSQYGFVSTAVHRVDAVGLMAIDVIRGAYLRPRERLQKLMDGVHGVVVRGASILAAHPLGRLPCRVTLAITGRISSFLDALQLSEDTSCLGEVFVVGRLHRIYNDTLTTLTVRLKTCHCVLEDLQKGTKDTDAETKINNMKKRKRSVNDRNNRTSSSSDDDPVEPLETESPRKDDGHHEEATASPVDIHVTEHD